MPGSGLTPLDAFTRFVRAMQIIVAAMTGGCLIFLVVVLVMAGNEKTPDVPIVTYIACVMTAAMIVARLVAPRVLVAKTRAKIRREAQNAASETSGGDRNQQAIGKLVQLFMTKLIGSVAPLEGVTFFLLISYLAERSPISLAMASVLIAAIAAHFPTRTGVVEWVDEQMRIINEDA